MPSPRSTCILQVVVLLASLTTPAPVLRAQIGATRFQHLTIAEGLSQNSVNAILQDRYGFLWFGTQDGLDRYDGRTFIGHRNSDRANSLSNNYIWALHEDDDGMIWIGTFGGGLDRYDPRTGTFTHHRHDPVDTTTIPSDRVFSIVQDAQGTLWLGTNNGLGALDPSTGKVRRYLVNGTTDRESRDHYVTALALQGDGLWMRTDSGLSHLNIRSGRITHHDLLPFSGKERLGDVLSVTVRNDDLYVTCGAGLVHINTALRTDSILLAPAAIPEIGPKASFTRLWIDGNNWWIGSTRGLIHWRPATGRTTVHQHMASDPQSLAHSSILALCQGRGHELWIATRNGLDRLDDVDPAIRLLRSIPGDANTPRDRIIGALGEDHLGNIWIGTPSGIDILDRTNGTMLHFAHDPSDPTSLPGDYILSLCPDPRGLMWIGTNRSGLASARLVNGRLVCDRYNSSDAPGSLNANTVHALTIARNGALWVGTAGGGVCRMDTSRGTFTCYPTTGDHHGPSHPYVYCITEEPNGMLWLGTPTGGLDLFDPDAGTFSVLKNDPGDRNSLSNDIVLALHRKDNALWVCTANGLNMADLSQVDPQDLLKGQVKNVSFTRYGRSQGFLNEVIYGLLEDRRGHFWMSTNLGIAEFDPEQGKVLRTFTTKDGLQNDEFNQNAFVRSHTGELFFGGVDGMNWFDPEKISPNPFVPPVHITRLLLMNEPVGLRADGAGDQALEAAIHTVQELDLSWRDKVIGFEFAALNFTNPDKNRYRYRLEGFDEDWVDAAHRNAVTYTNLDPGTYLFRVQGSNNDGIWNERGASLALHISTPPWRSWYAYLLYAAMLIGASTVYFRARLRQATREVETVARIERARVEDRERFRRMSAADFHDESGGKLTRINLHSGLARQRAANDPTLDGHLAHIEQAQRELSAGIRDLIWTMDPGRDTLRDTIERIAAFAHALFDNGATRFCVEGVTDAMRTVELDMEQRRAITLIMKEAVNNCAKHASADNCALVVHLDEHSIHLELRDDGHGFDRTTTLADDHYGMGTMHDRSRAIGARLHVQSTPGGGTTVRLSVPTRPFEPITVP
ncbi:MAG: two-component regulator propeller domain-containing protein [Flavobacteriales bacterium]